MSIAELEYQQVNDAAARVEARPRQWLEDVEQAARAYFAARRDGTRPEVVRAREKLRLLLNEDAPAPPPVKPWDR